MVPGLLMSMHLTAPRVSLAQDDETSGPSADQAAQEDADEDNDTVADEVQASEDAGKEGINVLKLFFRGGWLMLPIVAMLAVVVFFSIASGPGLLPASQAVEFFNPGVHQVREWDLQQSVQFRDNAVFDNGGNTLRIPVRARGRLLDDAVDQAELLQVPGGNLQRLRCVFGP